MDNKNINNELTAILEEYTKNLPEKIQKIATQWENISENWNYDLLKQLHGQVHSLHGSAGIFGYQEISDIASKLESILGAALKNNNISLTDKKRINELLQELKTESTKKPQKILLSSSPSKKTEKLNTLIYIVDIGYQLDNSSLNWSTELSKKLSVFSYTTQHFVNFDLLEKSISETIPLAILVNLNSIEGEEEKFITFQKKYLTDIPILFFASSGEFSLRVKAVKLNGQAYLVKPFFIDELIYELERIHDMNTYVYRALIVDDEIEIANYYATLLKDQNINCKIVTKIDDVDKVLHEFKPEIILLDYYMPECNGQQLAAIIRQQRLYEFIPIIFLSSEEDKGKQLDALRVGGDDFINKKTNPEHLILSIKNKAHRYKILGSITTKDNLTVALNKQTVLKQLESLLNDVKQTSESLSIAIIEINNFQKIITEFGNQAADQVLKNLCLMLRSRTRVFDIIGRYDEKSFLIIFPNTNLENAKSLVKDLEKHFMSLTYFYKNQIFNATFRAGLASTISSLNPNDLLEKAKP